MSLVHLLQAMLPGQVLGGVIRGAQLAVAGLGGHKEGLLEAQPPSCQCGHEGPQQRLRIALLPRTHTLLLVIIFLLLLDDSIYTHWVRACHSHI